MYTLKVCQVWKILRGHDWTYISWVHMSSMEACEVLFGDLIVNYVKYEILSLGHDQKCQGILE